MELIAWDKIYGLWPQLNFRNILLQKLFIVRIENEQDLLTIFSIRSLESNGLKEYLLPSTSRLSKLTTIQ